MKFTISWLKEHLDTDASVAEIAETLTRVGLEVEAIEDRAAALSAFTIAYVIEAKQHPNADRLRVCMVDTGAGQSIVAGGIASDIVDIVTDKDLGQLFQIFGGKGRIGTIAQIHNVDFRAARSLRTVHKLPTIRCP